MLVLLDATILTNFARVGLSYALSDLWGAEVGTTVNVLDEYETGIRTAGLPPLAWKELTPLILTPEEQVLASDMFPRLGIGEQTCLAVAIRRGAILATDDKSARRAAKKWGIQVVGTLGILRTCVRQGLFSQSKAQTFLEQMIAAGYYSPTQSL